MDFKEKNYKIESIAEIEQLDDFEDEYVYDVEVDDCHNFFANDVLVHNSIYVEFGVSSATARFRRKDRLSSSLTCGTILWVRL